MPYDLAKLIDVEKTQEILRRFLDVVGVPAAIIDLQGKVIVASQWQRICTDFHRASPITCRRCIESDTVLANDLTSGKGFSVYRCLNGLTDAASPIVIEGECLANVFVGQFLTNEPDLDFFSRQADEYGFDKSAYLQALSEVPVLSQDVLPLLLSFLTSFAEMITSLGLKQLRQMEIEKELQAAQVKLQFQNEELRAQNEELLSSREQIDSLARFPSESPDPLMRIAVADGRVLYANDAADHLLADLGTHTNGQLPPLWRNALFEAVKTGSPAKSDIQVQDKIFSITIVPVVPNNYVNIYARDITDRQRMEDELLRAKREWERTFDSVPDLIAILDPQHRIVRANREMALRIGVTPEECVGRLCHECIHGSRDVPVFCPHGRTMADGQEHIAEVHEETLGGDFLVSTTPLRDEQGNILGTVHVARDITGRKRMEEELRRSRDELDARVRERTADLARAVARLELNNQELQEFAFVASHDLHEPLRKIQGFCDLVLRSNGDRVDGKGKDYLFRMQKAANRMQQLLQDLLSYSRVITQPEPFRETDLKTVAMEAAEVFELKLRAAKGTIEISEMPVIEADPSQMARLFQNLIGNSVKYHGPENPLVRIYGEKDKSSCRIFVEDNGIGFEEKYLDRIFSPFQRLHGRDEYPGTGMGLAICRKIVERHGGSITANSTPGRGSTFIVTLPIAQKASRG